MEMYLVGCPGGPGCFGTQGSLQYLCSMTSMVHTLETTSQGKTSPLATGRDKSPFVTCVIYSFNKYSLKTYCVAKHGALQGSWTYRTARHHEELGARGKWGWGWE